MRYRQLLSLALTASVGAAVILTGCSAEPILPSKSEEYSREFIKNFGVFDRTHDWNHATRTTVDITTTRPTDVKIIADYDGKRYIFGSYTNVDGQKTLDVDIPQGRYRPHSPRQRPQLCRKSRRNSRFQNHSPEQIARLSHHQRWYPHHRLYRDDFRSDRGV